MPKMTKFKRPVILSKLILGPSKIHIHFFHYNHNKYTRFHKDPLKTVREVNYTKSIPDNTKIAKNELVQKVRNSLKINSRAIKNPHAHFIIATSHNKSVRFQKDPLINVGEVDYTNFTYYAKID